MALSARFLAGLVAVGALTSVSSGAVVITEIMYDPASSETTFFGEWVEIYNTGPAAVGLANWYLDDEDTGSSANWGAIPAGNTLNAGQVAVLFHDAFAGSAAVFRSDWAVPAEALVIGVPWAGISNSPNDAGVPNELLQLYDSSGVSQDAVNIENGGAWPTKDLKSSVYLTAGHLAAADNDLGSNWALSAVGVDNARNPIASPAKYNVLDTGSPGQVPVPEPGALGVLSLAGLMGLRRRR